jgi:glycosyltransferase involved in cell wall biosynthesis
VPGDVPAARVSAYPGFGWLYACRRAWAKTSADLTAAYLWAGRQFCQRILRDGLGDVGGVFTFNSAGLELLRHARARGLRAVMEQTIAPRRVEQRLLAEEHERFPDWEGQAPADPNLAEYCEREQAEWTEAEQILCGSEFVSRNLQACGVPAEKCVVVPYGVDARFAVPERPRHGGPLRVLTVGAVGLRKGSPYILEAARQLKGEAVFRMVGSASVSEKVREELHHDVDLTGPVPRSEILTHYAWADVFLLPSICEGSATVTYEALSCGLPVVCTPNAGSVVRDGTDGYVVPVRDVDALVDRLRLLRQDPEQREAMARHARERGAEFNLARYGECLTAALRN